MSAEPAQGPYALGIDSPGLPWRIRAQDGTVLAVLDADALGIPVDVLQATGHLLAASWQLLKAAEDVLATHLADQLAQGNRECFCVCCDLLREAVRGARGEQP